VRGRSLHDEYEHPCADVYRTELTGDDDMPPFAFYVALRAVHRFRTEMDRYPGTSGVPERIDVVDVRARVDNLLRTAQCDTNKVNEAVLSAVCGWGAREHAAVAAIIGGIGAHECIKLLTQQYTPLNNTLVYNGASAQSHVWTL